MSDKQLYAEPKIVTDLGECYFYHAMDIPGYGLVNKYMDWDLREKIYEYLGRVDFQGKRVLDVGTASGFLTFTVEAKGAKEVISYDLNESHPFELIPYAQDKLEEESNKMKDLIRRVNNAYWLAHRAYGSQAKIIYGSVYNIPKDIGFVDISILGSILLHLRDPFLALQNACRLTKEKVIVVDVTHPEKTDLPIMQFLPDYKNPKNMNTWWHLSPVLIQNFLGVLGFEKTTVNYHIQKFKGVQDMFFYTVVGERTQNI